jgi:hypothetical protein
MVTGTCYDCEKDFPDAELATLRRLADDSLSGSCRKCIQGFIKEGFLWHDLPFWKRKEGAKNAIP